MKSFNKFVSEASVYHSVEHPNNLGGSLEINTAQLSDPAVRRRLNAVVGQIGNAEYLVPEHAVHRLRGTLDKIGLSFPSTPVFEGQSGSFDLPLRRFGGRYGKDTDTPYDEVINDDGISHMVEGGLALKIQYEMIKNNSCRIFAKIE